MNNIIYIATVVMCFVTAIAYKVFVKSSKKNDTVEQFIESIIEKETGIDVDLAPIQDIIDNMRSEEKEDIEI